MKDKKISNEWIAWLIVAGVTLAVSLFFGVKYPIPEPPGDFVALGTTNFDSVVLSDDLTVGDDLTLTDDLTVSGGVINLDGATPLLTIGDAGAEDTTLLFDGNAQDYYMALDDTADDLLIGLGSTVGTTGILYFDENQDAGIGGASAGAKLDVTGNGIYDGAADEVQLTVQGYTTQTSNILVVENTGGTDLFWVTNDGDAEMNGTTPALTIGDAGEEDAQINFDGNAQDYHMGLDDTDDDLVLGVGTALGTTDALSIDENADVTIESDLTVQNSIVNNGELDQNSNINLDGDSDEVQLQVTGYTTQTNFLLLLEANGGADLFWVTNDGDAEMNGTTPFLTIGDAGEEDAGVVLDGNAQDYHIGLDDTADDLVIGLGSALGTTPAISVDENQDVVMYEDVTIGNAEEEDNALVWNGNAQDYYIGMDDNVDDLVIGLGSAVGTTPAFAIDENQVTTWTGGMIPLYETVAAANILTTAECGKTMFLNAETEFQTTLPAVSGAAGCSFTFIVASAPITDSYTIVTGNSLENVLYGTTHEADDAAAGPIGSGVDTLTCTAGVGVVGDWIEFYSDGTYWYYVAWVSAGTGWEPSTAD